MDDIPLWAEIAVLAVLLAVSAFFSIAETAMMALNRYRLRHLVAQGHDGARRAEDLLKHTDRLLGGILIGNTLVIAVSTMVTGLIAVQLFGEERLAWAITASTLVVSFLIVVFGEITPKVIGATYPERIALPLTLVIKPVQWLLTPAVWFVNLFVKPLLMILGIRPEPETPKLSPEEIRTLVLESSSFMPKKHFSILMNLFDLGDITVQDIMVPRPRIESVTLEDPLEDVLRELTTSNHVRLPVFRDHEGELLGVLHLKIGRAHV